MIARPTRLSTFDARPALRRWVLTLLALGAVLGLCVVARLVHEVGGVRAVRAVYQSWMSPGSTAFEGRRRVPPPDPPAYLDWWDGPSWWGGALQAPVPTPTPVGEEAFADQDRMYVLMLGVDYNHDTRGILYTRSARTDTIMVAALDRHARSLTLLSIPRDMRVYIPGHGWDKINSAWSLRPEGAADLTVRTVESFLGIHIDHLIVVKPYAAEHVVDALGGVTLDVEKQMDYDDRWGGLHIHLRKGVQHLDGRQAVGYIRFRHDPEGDRGRMRRQQQLIRALLAHLERIDTLSRLPDLRQVFAHDIRTTLTYEQMVDLAMLYRDFDRARLRSVSMDGDDASIGGTYYMIPDERRRRAAVARLRGRV